ncbi:sugar phosphate isomerase/epimerase family protein [Breznakiella homolactica]|uniref:TIM barrel protein n=1 Tax=Breznakiella homolactica TaxID=2798577 RepID=A0A7T7XMK9_9SPIR|nr:sugar phosphate isomerase/epimerase [Breznakiella homolactica]QQO09135.1 sugar phosphate isomerase/epimerase [Breznakiella homolactica]
MASTITIATAPCSWGVWYADGKPSGTPWNVFLDQAEEAGYKSLELGPDGYLPTEEQTLRNELSQRSLGVCAGTACYRFDQYNSFEDFRPRVETLCRRIKAFDAKYLVTMDESDVGTFSEKKKDFSGDLWKKYLTMFRDLGLYTKKEFGIETVFHPHIRSLIETEEEIVRMMDFCDLNLCFDTGHHAYVNGGTEQGDQSAVEFIRKYPERMVYLHFKNVDGKIRKKVADEHLGSDQAFDMDVMCDLRDGIIDFTELKKILDSINYQGIGVIEMDMPRATTDQAFAAAKRNLEYLREIQMIP